MRLHLSLSAHERAELETIRRRDPKPYRRERASALLQIANGASAAAVAQHGLLQPRRPDTVRAWVHRYAAEAAQAEVLDVLARAPRCFDRPLTRWRLVDVQAVVPWLEDRSLSAISRVLVAFGLSRKRARAHIHSPDPAYAAKRAAIASARADPTRVLCFLDEVTIYRQPTVAPVYALTGAVCPCVERSTRAETALRVVATLDARTGQVVALRRTKLTVSALVGFCRTLVAAYPPGTHFTLVLDNWPVHFHPDLLAALEPQHAPFVFPRPPSWPTSPQPEAVARWGQLQLPIQLLPLPTYASWLNPIEKLWRVLRQRVTHNHSWADDLTTLGTAIDAFLASFALGSPDLLRATGLAPPD
jgi:hypothetical protein